MRELASDLRGLTRQRVTGAGAPPALQANRRIWTLTAAVVLLSVGGLVWMSSQRGGGKAAIRSLAVLPLENLSGDSAQDYFSDGTTEELISTLARIRSIKVISRASVMRYKGNKRPLPEIGREIGVDAIVTGPSAVPAVVSASRRNSSMQRPIHTCGRTNTSAISRTCCGSRRRSLRRLRAKSGRR